MSEAIGTIEIDLNGEVKEKTGDFENEGNEAFIKNIMYILQDVNAIKTKKSTVGQFNKMTIKNSKIRYVIAVGSSSIKIKKYNL